MERPAFWRSTSRSWGRANRADVILPATVRPLKSATRQSLLRLHAECACPVGANAVQLLQSSVELLETLPSRNLEEIGAFRKHHPTGADFLPIRLGFRCSLDDPFPVADDRDR